MMHPEPIATVEMSGTVLDARIMLPVQLDVLLVYIFNFFKFFKCSFILAEGSDSNDWTSTYGVSADGSGGISLQFVTVGQYSTNIGSRVFMLDDSGNNYYMFKLKNKEFTMDVDTSELPCGLNGAVYFVEMDADGGMHYPSNKAILVMVCNC